MSDGLLKKHSLTNVEQVSDYRPGPAKNGSPEVSGHRERSVPSLSVTANLWTADSGAKSARAGPPSLAGSPAWPIVRTWKSV